MLRRYLVSLYEDMAIKKQYKGSKFIPTRLKREIELVQLHGIHYQVVWCSDSTLYCSEQSLENKCLPRPVSTFWTKNEGSNPKYQRPEFLPIACALHRRKLVKIRFLAAESRCSILKKLHEFTQLDRFLPNIASWARTKILEPLTMDGEAYVVDTKTAVEAPSLEDGEKPLKKELEPFGDEETADVKYRTMKWW